MSAYTLANLVMGLCDALVPRRPLSEWPLDMTHDKIHSRRFLDQFDVIFVVSESLRILSLE